MDKNKHHFRDGEIDVYPNYEYHPISIFMAKIPVLRVLANLIRYFENGYRISKILNRINKKEKITSVEFSEGGNFWNAITKRYHYVTHLHGSSFIFKKLGLQKISFSDIIRRKAELFFIIRSNLIVAPSKMISDFVSAEIKKSLTPVVIPYPVDKMFFRKNKIRTKNINRRINILFAARNDPVKGGDLLIQAIKKLPDSMKNKINVNFFGYEPRQQDIPDTINFHEFIPQNKLINEYIKTDICVIPSIFDNSPYTIHEAMALGKILVVSDAGGIPEAIGGPECGYIFKSGSIIDLKLRIIDAVDLILSGKSMIMSQNAKNRKAKLATSKDNINRRLALLEL